MISRRNIRIKVMQVLYAVTCTEKRDFQYSKRLYHAMVNQVYDLYLYNLMVFTRVLKLAEADARLRNNKHLPSDEDKAFHAKIYRNVLTQSIVTDITLKREWKQRKFAEKLNHDVLLILYNHLAAEETYQEYVLRANDAPGTHSKQLLWAYKTLAKHLDFAEMMEEHFANWHQDSSLVIGSMKRTLKSLPVENDFHKTHLPDRQTTHQFGERLLMNVLEQDQNYLEAIDEVLENWDSERVASIDMIVLKMALSELLQFQSIPPKVTINEYVEIAKQFSTDKSKDFVNGILDKLMRKLRAEGRILKSGRGLVD